MVVRRGISIARIIRVTVLGADNHLALPIFAMKHHTPVMRSCLISAIISEASSREVSSDVRRRSQCRRVCVRPCAFYQRSSSTGGESSIYSIESIPSKNWVRGSRKHLTLYEGIAARGPDSRRPAHKAVLSPKCSRRPISYPSARRYLMFDANVCCSLPPSPPSIRFSL